MNTNLHRIVNNLSEAQKLELLTLLRNSLSVFVSNEVIVCPCCNESNFRKDGKYKAVQKYECKSTGKVFTYKTNTVISGISKINKLTELVNMLGEGDLPTLSKIKKQLGVSHQTAFDWRNKILSALYSKPSLDNQIIEFDEFFHHLSRKGRQKMAYGRKRGSRRNTGDNKYTGKVFMAFSRSTGKTDFYFSHLGRTKANDVANYLGTNKEIVVYSDSHRSYSKFCDENGVGHSTFKAKEHISQTEPSVHVQTINAYAGKFKDMINHYHRGVSTKYIQGYCNWFSFTSNEIRNGIKPNEKIIENKFALQIHKQKEKEFQYLLRNSGRTNFGDCKIKYKLVA
jgi:transposase-like protein